MELTAQEMLKREKLKETNPYIYAKILRQEQRYLNGLAAPTIQFQYDYTCNMRCEHCCVSKIDKKDRVLTPDVLKDLARQADELAVTQFTISGGEPLLFRDFEKIVQAIGPDRFFIATDTNGWLLTPQKAAWLKNIGVGKVHISLDSALKSAHDAFRKTPGAYEHAIAAITNAKKAGLSVTVNTVLTKERVHTDEFLQFLQLVDDLGATTVLMFAKPLGEWEGNLDILLDDKDIAYTRELEKKHAVCSHLTRNYGFDHGCLAVKRMISITRYGDVQPCMSILVSLGNIFDEPLETILERGMRSDIFGAYSPTCRACADKDFVALYNERTLGKAEPLAYADFISKNKS